MSQLVTFSKKDKEFQAYLEGTFSKTHRALPLKTLNANTASEAVTFKIVPVIEIQSPSFLHKIFQLYKVRTFLLVLVPLLLTFTKNMEDGRLRDSMGAWTAFAGVLLAFIAVNLRNDYVDHMKGVDRVLERSGSRAIQSGWVTAAQVKTASNIFLVLSLFIGILLVLSYPKLVGVIAISSVIGLWAQFNKTNSFKYRVGGEVCLFLMLGPLLTLGYQIAMGARPDTEVLLLGSLWGWLILFVMHLKNFMNIFMSSQAGFKNTINYLGFDKARRLIIFWWVAYVVFSFAYHIKYASNFWGLYSTVVLALCSFPFLGKLRKVSSPIGGEMRALFRSGFHLFLLSIFMWSFECIWYLLR